MRLIASLVVLSLWLAGAMSSGHAQQTQMQAFAQQRYNEYNVAREQTWRARSQGQHESVINQLAANERAAWDAFTQANAAAQAEANQAWIVYYVSQVDANIIAWQNYVQAIYNGRNNSRYATDRAYYDWWNAQTYGPLTYAQSVIAHQTAYRQQLVASAQGTTPVTTPPVSPDPRYSLPNGEPDYSAARSWIPSLTPN